MSDQPLELTEFKGRQVAAPYTGDDPVMEQLSKIDAEYSALGIKETT